MDDASSRKSAGVDRPAAREGDVGVRRRQRSLLALATEAKAGRGGGPPRDPGGRGWVRGAFRFEPSKPFAHGLVSSLALHGALGAAVVAGVIPGFGTSAIPIVNMAASAVVIELPKIPPPEPRPVFAAAPARSEVSAPAAPAGEIEGPVPKGLRSRKGNDAVDDAKRAGVLGMLTAAEGRGKTASRKLGGSPGPDQGSAMPFTGAAGLRDYEGSYLPAGGGGGTGVGADEGSGTGGGRGSGKARGLLNSYGDGTGDEIVLERRGSARGVTGGVGSGSGGGGCRGESSIARVVETHKGAIRRCYNSALQRDEGILGEISVRFVIAESGAVRAAEIVGKTVKDAELEACVIGELRSLQFEEAASCETVVRYTFNLTRSL